MPNGKSCECDRDFRPGIVLDMFAGSGTTLVVAKKLGRDFVGIELNPEYVKIAEARLASV
jgi:site-specific DNA-methyltransferase (adenine-specific)